MASAGSNVIESMDKYDIKIDMILEAIDKGVVGPIVQVDTDEGDKILIEIA